MGVRGQELTSPGGADSTKEPRADDLDIVLPLAIREDCSDVLLDCTAVVCGLFGGDAEDSSREPSWWSRGPEPEARTAGTTSHVLMAHCSLFQMIDACHHGYILGIYRITLLQSALPSRTPRLTIPYA